MIAKAKNYDSTYLYGKGGNSNELYKFIISAERIDKDSTGFDDVVYMVKRNQYSSCLNKVLLSNNVILGMSEVPLPRSFKIFAAKDAKASDHPLKVFVDVSGLIKKEGTNYVLKNKDSDIFISYLLSAMNTLIYYAQPTKLTNNSTIIQTGTSAFAALVSNVIDYMRIGSVDNIRAKVKYIAAMYFQTNLLEKDITESITTRAEKISGIKGREAEMFSTKVYASDYKNIETFVGAIARVLNVESLKLENFIDKWFFLYGAGTQYALELFPAFASVLTNAYVGAYLNNQKQIEKLCARDMVDFTNATIKVGSELA